MPRSLKIILWVFGVLLGVLVFALVLVLAFDWNKARPWVAERASEVAGRPVAIRGDLSLDWIKPDDDRLTGWRAWVRWPQLTANDVLIGNPPNMSVSALPASELAADGTAAEAKAGDSKQGDTKRVETKQGDTKQAETKQAETKQGDTKQGNAKQGNTKQADAKQADAKQDDTKQPDTLGIDAATALESQIPPGSMAQISSLSIILDPLSLLDHTVRIPVLTLRDADLSLLRTANGQNNWTFTREKDERSGTTKWRFDLQRLVLEAVNISLNDAVSKVKLAAEIDSIDGSTEDVYGIAWKAEGHYNEGSITGEGRAGKILNLRDSAQPYPFEGNLHVGGTAIAVEGSVTEPKSIAALDVRLDLKGKTMSDLFPLTGIALPNTPPYSTSGHLVATLDGENDIWRYEDFTGTVGQSDVQGTLEYVRREPRALLRGEVRSKLLRFADLGPLVGVDKRDNTKEGKREKPQPSNKALPVDKIATDTWSRMDADVKFTGQKIVRGKNLPLDDIRTHIKLNDSVLNLQPLNFGVAGGDLSANIRLNGKGETIKADMSVSARHLKLKRLFPGAESMDASFGELHGDARLSAQGDSIAALLGSSNGEINALVSRGTISHFLLEAAGLNIANLVFLKIFGDEQVILNCLAGDFKVTDGLVQVQAFQLDTEDTLIDVLGDVNLAKETLDLDVRPANKSVRIFTLRSPLYVKGTFKDPDVGVYTGALAARAGAAIVLGVVATPFAAIIPLLNVGTEDSNDCGQLLKQASDKPEAPLPGQAKPVDRVKGSVSGKDSGSVTGSVSGAAPAGR